MTLAIEPRGIHRRIQIEVTPAMVERFHAKVDRGTDDDCWLWKGATRNGYGAIKHNGSVLGTHVVAFVIAHGPVPAGHIITHECDERLCCNPSHLRAGTFQSNVREAYDRREVNALRGGKHPGAVLTDDLVRQIRELRAKERIGARTIAKRLGISESGVKAVIYGRTWKHLITAE
jgi:hypothetical protein